MATSPASPLGEKEETFLENYFLFISQFAFDKAKDIVEKEQTHKGSAMSPWGQLIHSLAQFAAAEKTYMSLTFLEQKWFARSRDSLRHVYQLLGQDFRKVEESVRQQENGLPGPSWEFEQLLAHLCGQLCNFLAARQRTMDFYEQMSAMGTYKSMNYEDLVKVITDINKSNTKSFHHPLLSYLKSSFSMECEIVSHLLNAQMFMTQWQFLPSLFQLHQAHSKLMSWGAAAQVKEHKKSFGVSSVKHGMWPALYQWLLKYKSLLVSKFSLYFYEILSKQTVPNEMKNLITKTSEDFVSKIIIFQKKCDAKNISLVLDIQGIEESYKGPGYHYPNKICEPPKGLDCYPAIFSYPQEKPSSVWPNVVMLINQRNSEPDKVNSFYDKKAQCTYFTIKVDTRLNLVVLFETRKSEKDSYVVGFLTEMGILLKCSKLFTSLKPSVRA
ncbi:hypothetical protein ScPMuIL_007593 [Solemya velum]